jgi:hypothetical protein
MKLGRKNEILKVSDIRIGTVLTFKGLNELTGPDGDYYDKRNGKKPLFSIGSIGEEFFDKKFRIIGPYGSGPVSSFNPLKVRTVPIRISETFKISFFRPNFIVSPYYFRIKRIYFFKHA